MSLYSPDPLNVGMFKKMSDGDEGGTCAYCGGTFSGHNCHNCGAPYTPRKKAVPKMPKPITTTEYR